MSTLKIALSLLTILLGIAVVTTAAAVAAERPYSTPVIRAAAFGCTFDDGQLICGTVKKHRRTAGQQGGNEGDGTVGEPPCRPGGAAGLTRFGMRCDVQGGHKNKKKKKDVDVESQGERSCPPGYVVLKEKNKYGAFCEPKEGFPAQADQDGAGPVPAASRNVCCKPGEGGPYVCSSDSTPPEAEASIRSSLQKLFPEGHVTCAPERAQGGIPPGF
ncbi:MULTISPECIES: hypothetical protein [unclassified Mesorhizobium]|uniref:hypothetical protein n=1 Tax=unclassified Mesorhizobium TaxID=325217 RepID=UPI000F764E74|nr:MULTISPECIES: hypothetical protein [unclassified Mesorhizobium]AZO28545.1 hypothetical protein EJ071_14845 [Mesorhizobium sp. M1B.F.Ca.ET.045.04.1.1]RWA69339.1 MAG: hypothetical protein EOQ29_17345 [Mesorhizobium sp.]